MNLQKISKKELRHLSFSEMSQVASIIDNNNNWIKILEAIPKDLNKISKKNLNGDYERKYNSEDADILRTAAQRQQKSPSFMLLFEEWGTSGRQRPTLQHLYELLIFLPLFRAADYISDRILHIQRPIRPNIGRAKRIDITLPEDEINSNRMRDFLEAYRYPNSTSIEQPEFETNYENQDNIYANNSSYNKSNDLPRNQFTESSSISSSESTVVTETDIETSKDDNDTARSHSSYTNKIPYDIEHCSLFFEQIRVDDGQVNMPDLSTLKVVNC